jgi:anti-sigma B factor antagonist
MGADASSGATEGVPESWRLALRGELDANSAPELQTQLDELIDHHAQIVIVDLADVTFLDSSGLRTLVHGARALEDQGGRLLVENASAAAKRILELTGLLEALTEGRDT